MKWRCELLWHVLPSSPCRAAAMQNRGWRGPKAVGVVAVDMNGFAGITGDFFAIDCKGRSILEHLR